MMIAAALPLVTAAISAAGGAAPAAAAKLGGATSAVSGAGDSFSSMMASFAQGAVGNLKGSEQMAVAGIEGKATTQSVVEAMMSAQESLQTAIAVRDKAVSAFQDISRMPI